MGVGSHKKSGPEPQNLEKMMVYIMRSKEQYEEKEELFQNCR